MAKRPWATPEDVKNYTEYPSVKKRSDSKIAVDITRAEQYIISYTSLPTRGAWIEIKPRKRISKCL